MKDIIIVDKTYPDMNDFVGWMNLGCEQFGRSFHVTKKLLLQSGLSISIQASSGHYCFPRENSECESYEIYSEFEIGFPSKKIDKIIQYAEQPEFPTETVYGYVPKNIIQEIIDDNGGVVGFYVREKS